MVNARAIEYAKNVPADEVNGDGLTFADYLTKADEYCETMAEVSIFDLADYMWWDAWNDGMSCQDAVDELLQEEGYGFLY